MRRLHMAWAGAIALSATSTASAFNADEHKALGDGGSALARKSSSAKAFFAALGALSPSVGKGARTTVGADPDLNAWRRANPDNSPKRRL